jgi:uncharacterized protein (DUF1697 family)
MIGLKNIFKELGGNNVKTYMQRGNVLFDSPTLLNVLETAELSNKIREDK